MGIFENIREVITASKHSRHFLVFKKKIPSSLYLIQQCTRCVFYFLNDKHVNTQELVQTDFQRFMGIGNFTRANEEETKVYMTKKRPGCQKTGILKMHCR